MTRKARYQDCTKCQKPWFKCNGNCTLWQWQNGEIGTEDDPHASYHNYLDHEGVATEIVDSNHESFGYAEDVELFVKRPEEEKWRKIDVRMQMEPHFYGEDVTEED